MNQCAMFVCETVKFHDATVDEPYYNSVMNTKLGGSDVPKGRLMFFVIRRGAPGITDNIPSPFNLVLPPLRLYASDNVIFWRSCMAAIQCVIGSPDACDISRSLISFKTLRKLWRRTSIGIVVGYAKGAPTRSMIMAMSASVGK